MTSSGPDGLYLEALLARLALVATAALALAVFAVAPASARRAYAPRASVAAARVVPRPLLRASIAAHGADRALVADAWRLRACLRAHSRRPARCNGVRSQLQHAGMRLKFAEQRLARIAADARGIAARRVYRPRRRAPLLSVVGDTLDWTRVAGMDFYVLVRKVPGQPDQYAVVRGISVTPPPVPGETVRYSVRTTAPLSVWATERSITYPKPGERPHGEGPHHGGEGPHGGGETPRPDPQAAPALTVTGRTLTWNAVAGVTTYVLVAKVPGRSDAYSEVTGTSVTPAGVAGATVRYSVRTAVEGSAWAPEASISYPAVSSTPPPPPPPPPGGGGSGSSGSSGPMSVALNVGGWNWESAIDDAAGAAKYFRGSYKYFDNDTEMTMLANAGVTLMPLFGEGGTLAGYDNQGFAEEIVAWFKRYGHGGTFWAGRSVDLGATTAELINEPGNPYFYPDSGNAQLYANITKLVHGALEANFAPAVRPKLLVSYDGGFSGSEYGRAIFADGAVADGVTVHPYGGHGGISALGNRERVAQAHTGTGLPVYITEIGWPTAVGQAPTGDSLQWTEQQQAENITGFMSWARSLGYVADVTYFNYADYGSNDYYGIVNSTGKVHKLSYEALRAASAAG